MCQEKNLPKTGEPREEEGKKGNKQSWLIFFAPLFAAFIDYFGLGNVTPLLPFFVDDFTGSTDGVGYILSAQYGGVIFGSALAGYASDRFGRKRTLAAALLGDIVFFSATGFVKSVPAMCAIRFLAGFCTPLAAVIAWVNDASGDDMNLRANVQGKFAMSSVLGFMMGAAMGGALGYRYFELMNVICGGLALAAFILVARAVEPVRPNAGQPPSGIKNIVRSRHFLSLLSSYFVVGLQFTAIVTLFSIVLMEKYKYEEIQVSACLMAVTAMHFFMMVGLQRLVKALKTPSNVIVCGYAIALVAHVVFLFPIAYKEEVLSVVLFLLASLCMPLALACGNLLAPIIADKYGENARGATIGILRMVFNCGQALGPTFGVLFFRFSGGGTVADGGWFFFVQGLFLLVAITSLLIFWGTKSSEIKEKKWVQRAEKVYQEDNNEIELSP